jgi:alpha-mannosidase
MWLTVVTEKDDGIFILGNGKIEVTIQGGQILSLIDIELDRELIPEGQKANRLILYDDQPLYWDAWDVEIYHLETPRELGLGETTIVDQGPLRVGLLVKHQISDESWIETTISLDAYIPSVHNYGEGFKDPLTYLQFECDVNWHENRRFLKAEFPVDIYCDTVLPLLVFTNLGIL